jgi:hypothetical protein
LNEQSISYKRYISDSWLVKFNFDVSGLIESIDREVIDRDGSGRIVKTNISDSYVEISTQLFNQLIRNKYLNLFFGIGPSFKYIKSENKTNYPDRYISSFNNYTSVFGAVATAYIEVNIHKSIFLLGKYDLSASYYLGKSKRNDISSSQDYREYGGRTYRWYITTEAITLGLSIYF